MSNDWKIPQEPEPIWREGAALASFPPISENMEADVVVIGAGITGVTTAYLLAKDGRKVILAEADRVLNGTTGHTTAKITVGHDLIYNELIQHFGQEKAKQYFLANKAGMEFIEKAVNDLNIDCDFKKQTSYLYATADSSLRNLQKELEAYEKLGIKGDLVERLSIDVPVKSAISLPEQAKFHPVKYLAALLQAFIDMGGTVYEQSVAVDVQESKRMEVIFQNGCKISCDKVAACSHFPFFDGKGFYFARMYAERSYLIAVKPQKAFPGGMYLSVDDPKRSVRSASWRGEDWVLIGGESHKTGQGRDTSDHYAALADFGDRTFGIREYAARWSAQDLITLDKVPYIGPVTGNKSNVLVATGFRKWGMTNGTAAALLFKDVIAGKPHPYADVFNPSRFSADPSIKHFVMQNADVAAHLLKGKLEMVQQSAEDLKKDEGGVVFHNGKRTGGYRDQDGVIHLVDTTCTHLGCECEWNKGDRTWDCPCHGSRFSYEGEVVEGPAKKPLKKIE
ncbi:FAD-dependent oxidoreductase [Falsibacillus albus]|uniref:FAD-dependent oxidoreductase n=1 Tax=Falsibacillus albus TaxID=2478915 RepID=A0A3L7JX94_9BACI|nr:FAD-dependent oxidoreductase [Falsibacillus albus]RLQ93062.1 FAD-dependent oxidoreductase [Falsibacillus albus]